jgi:hypothetical protein
MIVLKALNLLVRFILELWALVALGYWGFQTQTGIGQWVLGLGAPIVMIMVWGNLVAPKASNRLVDPLRLVVEVGVFVVSGLALAAAGQSTLAVILLITYGVSVSLMFVWRQRTAA